MMKQLSFLGELSLLTVQQKETLIHSHNISQEAKRIKSNSLFFLLYILSFAHSNDSEHCENDK